MKEINKMPPEIAILAKKQLENTISLDEKVRLEAWYDQQVDEKPIWNLIDQDKDKLQERLYQSIHSKIQFLPRTRRSVWKNTIAIAATLAVMVTAGILAWRTSIQKSQFISLIHASANGSVKKIYLPDHSLVWLKGNSTLDYPSEFSDSSRNVTLVGEALFEVTKDKAHPFFIKTGNYLTKVVGTSFNIKENSLNRTFQLTVLTGQVVVSSTTDKANQKPFLVSHGSQLEISSEQSDPRVLPAIFTERNKILTGTEYDMSFENIAFEEVKRRVEKKFNVKINIGKNDYSNCFISADVTDQSLENTLKVISAVTNSQYSVNTNQIYLTGGGCN